MTSADDVEERARVLAERGWTDTATLLRTLLRERDEARSKALDEAAKVVRFKLGLHFEDVAKAILSLKDTQT